MHIRRFPEQPFWSSWGVLVARIIVGGVFAMAAAFKFMGMESTAAAITAAGIPYALPLAWIAAIVETLLALMFLTGAYFRLAAFFSIIYILFLAFMFHGPQVWEGNPMEFGFFVDHFTFTAGLLYMLAHGPGPLRLLKRKP